MARTRLADRALAPDPGEAHTFGRDPIQIGGLDQRVTGAAHHVVTVLIAEHPQDVRRPRLLLGSHDQLVSEVSGSNSNPSNPLSAISARRSK